METLYATTHAIRRIRTRTKIPIQVSRVELMGQIQKRMKGREREIAECMRTGRAFEIEGEAFYFCRLFSEKGEGLLLKSYWAGEPTGLRKIKLLVKRFLLRHLNEW